MVNRNWHLQVAAIVILLSSAAAQSSLDLVGFGLVHSTPDVVGQGIGGITSVPPGMNQWLSTAPASWNRIRATQLHAAFSASRTNLSDSESLAYTGLENLQFLIFINQRTSYNISIQPVTRALITLRDTAGIDTFGLDASYIHDQSFEGGISSFKLGFSKRIGTTVSVGANLDILFGTLIQEDYLEFLNKGDLEYPNSSITSERRLEFNGQRLELGFLADVPPQSGGELGINAVIPLRLKMIDVQVSNSWFEPNRTVHRDIGTQADITMGYSVGLAEKYRFLTEIELTRLVKGEENDMLFGRVLDGTRSLRIGFTRNPGEDEPLSIGRLYYRVGFSCTNYYLSSLKNRPLTEFGFSLGLGFQAQSTGSRLESAIQIGRRDGLPGKVQTEDFWRISIGVVTSELWFARPNKRWD